MCYAYALTEQTNLIVKFIVNTLPQGKTLMITSEIISLQRYLHTLFLEYIYPDVIEDDKLFASLNLSTN